MAKAKQRAPRRMRSEDRRAQLVDAAIASIAERGSIDFSLDDVAERAGVTRNLLYHYFPRGRRDLELAALDQVGRQLTDGFITDPDVPLDEKLERNFGAFFLHAWEQTEAWRVLIVSGSIADPELRAASDPYRDRIIAAIAINHLGTEDPGPLARLALRGFLDFAVAVLDRGREAGVEGADVVELLRSVLYSTVGAVRGRG